MKIDRGPSDHPHRAHYVVGDEVQNVLGGVVVHHEGVLTTRPQIIGTPYHGRVLVLEYGFQHLQVLVASGVLGLLNISPIQGQQHPT